MGETFLKKSFPHIPFQKTFIAPLHIKVFAERYGEALFSKSTSP